MKVEEEQRPPRGSHRSGCVVHTVMYSTWELLSHPLITPLPARECGSQAPLQPLLLYGTDSTIPSVNTGI